ncbi:XK-related protein 6-like isoform X1 [Cimex lectularius]|uniref:XK-related protein n=1 Tax=Cimex lectularius TaxID=79782 RepID=A0A8I6SLF7_CIMLE|nr:XK-related protein 6-like isoform X1 [Cimex lectularius]
MSERQFLPLCDLLFNLISLACYFCDIVFDLTMGYALYQKGQYFWGGIIVFFVLFSLTVCQIFSIFWYLKTKKRSCGKIACLILVHSLSLGVIWRHFKLLLPVDLSWIKSEMRDICVLRLLHGFLNSGPTLLIQLHLFLNYDMETELKDLSALSVCLSVFSICWALSSYSKNLKRRNIRRLVLTWPGVITQFMWRLGTVGTRAICLVLYSSLYGPWVLVVVLLHWISMFLWIVSTELFAIKQTKTLARTWTSALVAFVYILAYINIHEGKHRHKMVVYYVVMTLENSLLCFSWYLNAPKTNNNEAMPLFLTCTYTAGILFMLLYYRFFHIRRLKYDVDGSVNVSNEVIGESSVTVPENEEKKKEPPKQEPHQIQSLKPSGRYNRYYSGMGHHHNGIPGVFNCRFTNPYSAAISKRKKKKPTSFVPPPSILPSQHCPVPFWCRPLVSEDKTVVRSPVDIRAKLEEKKQQQLAELRDIEEEIMRRRNGSDYPQELAPSYLGMTNPEVIPYTLPRQSRYFKRYRKPTKPARYCPPANSSDGDVDSLDDNENDNGGCWYTMAQHKLRHNPRVRHETKL